MARTKENKQSKSVDTSTGIERKVSIRSSLNGLCSCLDDFKNNINENIIRMLKETPFGNLFDAILQKRITTSKKDNTTDSVNKVLKTFNLSSCEFRIGSKSITFTTNDLALLFGVPNVGSIKFPKGNLRNSEFIQKYFNGSGKIKKTDVSTRLKELSTKMEEEYDEGLDEDFVKLLLLYMLATLFYANGPGIIPQHAISAVIDLKKINDFNWAADIHRELADKLSKCETTSHFAGCAVAILYFICEKVKIIEPIEGNEALTPRVTRWDLQILQSTLKEVDLATVGSENVYDEFLEISHEETLLLSSSNNLQINESIGNHPMPKERPPMPVNDASAGKTTLAILEKRIDDQANEIKMLKNEVSKLTRRVKYLEKNGKVEAGVNEDDEENSGEQGDEHDEEKAQDAEESSGNEKEEEDDNDDNEEGESSKNGRENYEKDGENGQGKDAEDNSKDDVGSDNVNDEFQQTNHEDEERGEGDEKDGVDEDSRVGKELDEHDVSKDIVDVVKEINEGLEKEKANEENKYEEKTESDAEMKKEKGKGKVEMEGLNEEQQRDENVAELREIVKGSIEKGVKERPKRKQLEDPMFVYTKKEKKQKKAGHTSKEQQVEKGKTVLIDDDDFEDPPVEYGNVLDLTRCKIFKMLTSKEKNAIQKDWCDYRRSDLVWCSKEERINITVDQLEDLLSNRFVNGSIIDWFAYKLKKEGTEKKFTYISHFDSKPKMTDSLTTKICNFDVSSQMLIFPLNHSKGNKDPTGYHWSVLILCMMKPWKWFHFNSMMPRKKTNDKFSACAKNTVNIVEGLLIYAYNTDNLRPKPPSRIKRVQVDCPQQLETSVDCGLYVCQFISNATKGQDFEEMEIDPHEITKLRGKIVAEIVSDEKYCWIQSKKGV